MDDFRTRRSAEQKNMSPQSHRSWFGICAVLLPGLFRPHRVMPWALVSLVNCVRAIHYHGFLRQRFSLLSVVGNFEVAVEALFSFVVDLRVAKEQNCFSLASVHQKRTTRRTSFVFFSKRGHQKCVQRFLCASSVKRKRQGTSKEKWSTSGDVTQFFWCFPIIGLQFNLCVRSSLDKGRWWPCSRVNSCLIKDIWNKGWPHLLSTTCKQMLYESQQDLLSHCPTKLSNLCRTAGSFKTHTGVKGEIVYWFSEPFDPN